MPIARSGRRVSLFQVDLQSVFERLIHERGTGIKTGLGFWIDLF
jgi:hypothetical protein